MFDSARSVFAGIHFPHFLQSNTIGLWLTFLPEIELLEQLFRQVTMATLCKYRTLGKQFHTSLKIILRRKATMHKVQRE
jgi:hypothetical protein